MERVVIYKHALKNALIPVVTIVGGQLGTLLAGTVIVETIFALPGMGRLTVEAIFISRLSGGADKRHAGGGNPRDIELAGGSDLCMARSADSVSVKAAASGESDVNSNNRRLGLHLAESRAAEESRAGPVELHEA